VIYLTGASNPPARALARRQALGLIVQPLAGYGRQIEHYPYWAADNGKFNPATYIGDDAWLAWVDGLPRTGCLFVCVPDVARRPDGELGGDPDATWAAFRRLGPQVRSLGFRAALVAQDGMENMTNVDEQIDACACLFLGGSTEWKTSTAALELAAQAKAAGKWTHMGRVNSRERYAMACAAGIDSADGTFLAFGPDANAPRLERWLLAGAQLSLWQPWAVPA